MASDGKGRVALKLLALLSGREGETEAAQAGEEVQKIWTEAHTAKMN